VAEAPRARASRAHLQAIIAALDQGVMLIDPAGGIVWANQAALAAHGVPDREALGGTIDAHQARFTLRYRNNRPVEGAAHPLERLAAGEAFEDVRVERLDPAGDAVAVLRLRGLVLRDEAGEPETLVLILHDETEVADAEQRFERAFNANPAPAVICRLADFRYIKVNPGFLAMTGYRREQILGTSAYEIDVLEQATHREQALARLREGAAIAQMEVTLSLPGGGSKLAMVAGQPLEMGAETCMLFTFIDLEPRRRAEAALRRAKERFEQFFRLAPVPTAILAVGTLHLLDVNAAFCALIGHAAEAAIGRSPAGLSLWAERGGSIDRALAEGFCRALEVRLRAGDGTLRDCLLSADALRAAPVAAEAADTLLEQDCVLIVLQDVTERRERELDLMNAIEAVMQDTTWFSRTIAEKVANLRQGSAGPRRLAGLADLTRRESQALGLICRGLRDADIAASLGLKLNTVRNHVASLYAKIGVHSRAEAIIWGRERGITGPPA
jgi:PAS domain S-box-containing protein